MIMSVRKNGIRVYIPKSAPAARGCWLRGGLAAAVRRHGIEHAIRLMASEGAAAAGCVASLALDAHGVGSDEAEELEAATGGKTFTFNEQVP